MHLFYTPDIGTGDSYTLNEEESRHCTRVLRLKKGDIVYMTDGKGTLFETVVDLDSLKKTTVRIISIHSDWGARSYRLHIAIAPTKSLNRFEWFLEKATEIGIDQITPLICEHAERKTLPKERMNRILIAAIKQSLKTTLPVLDNPEQFQSFIRKSCADKNIMAHYDPTNVHMKDNYSPGEDVLIMIGPEGDFSPQEIRQARDAGFIMANLGSARLRTETAGVVACSMINVMND
ncbi:MAG: 16S rRNA (uracil(1498)-N(3))-methyltransferase [Bacteroidales bacterium]|nr:16S rRNA (uracil(1498)-N(3))-methyltransferase [Lentimicrobiaceae bacterium]MDD5695959.1 16S rRNA (uracil(1498)-N(3))-methyltransferase [Bacteroidales bacterium]